MIRKLMTMSLLFVLSVVIAKSQTLDQILTKHYEARGGLKNIKAIQTSEFHGKMSIGEKEFPLVIYRKRTGEFRSEISMDGKSVIQVYDGKNGWQINPRRRSSDPQEITGKQLQDLTEQADIDGILVDWKEKGYKLKLIGKEKVDDKDAFHIEVTRKDTTTQHMYIDAKSYLLIQQMEMMRVRRSEINVITKFSDFRKVENIVIPFVQTVAGSMGQHIKFEKIFLNKPISDSLFMKPEVVE